MDDMYKEPIPYIVYESEVTRLERVIHKLTRVLIIAIVLGFITNAIWVVIWNSYDYEDISVESASGNANFIGNDGIINNGEGEG